MKTPVKQRERKRQTDIALWSKRHQERPGKGGQGALVLVGGWADTELSPKWPMAPQRVTTPRWVHLALELGNGSVPVGWVRKPWAGSPGRLSQLAVMTKTPALA
jgi:hypothetical protein